MLLIAIMGLGNAWSTQTVEHSRFDGQVLLECSVLILTVILRSCDLENEQVRQKDA